MNYMNLTFSRKVRRNYDAGRRTLRISITPEVHKELGRIGAMRLIEGKDGKNVAEKGGYGSGFIELATRLLLRVLSLKDAGIDTHKEIADAIVSLLPGDEEKQITKENLLKIIEYL